MRLLIQTNLFVLLFLVCSISISAATPQQEADSPWFEYILKSDAKKMGNYFAPMIKLELPTEKGDYNKSQAVMILSAFFEKHPAKTASIQKSGKSSQSNNFFIGEYKHANQVFRLYIHTHEINNKQVIHSLSITKK